jgi:hypothetical protein
MRETHEVKPSPTTELEILRHGIHEIATHSTGGHQIDPCYGARREIIDFAKRILSAAEAASGEA